MLGQGKHILGILSDCCSEGIFRRLELALLVQDSPSKHQRLISAHCSVFEVLIEEPDCIVELAELHAGLSPQHAGFGHPRAALKDFLGEIVGALRIADSQECTRGMEGIAGPPVGHPNLDVESPAGRDGDAHGGNGPLFRLSPHPLRHRIPERLEQNFPPLGHSPKAGNHAGGLCGTLNKSAA